MNQLNRAPTSNRNFTAVSARSAKNSDANLGIKPSVNFAQQQRVLRQFRLVFSSLKTQLQRAEHVGGLGGAQRWALALIDANPGLSVNALAQAMDVQQSTASNLVRSLANHAFLEVRKEAADKRFVQLHLTATGSRALAQTRDPFSGALPSALRSLDGAILNRLDGDLLALLAAVAATLAESHQPGNKQD